MRILVIKLSSFGDLFHALPAVHCLKEGLNASVDWVTQHSYVDLVRCFTDVDRVIPFYRNAFFKNIAGWLRELRAEEYDLIVDFQGLWKSASVACLARGGRRIGPSFHREGTRLVYHSVAGDRNRHRHAVDEALDIVRHLKLSPLEPEFPVVFPDRTVTGRNPKIALVPFSRWQSKNWPVSSFISLANQLGKRVNASVFLIGGPDDSDACEEIESQSCARNLAGKFSLPELGGFLKNMELVISNDSGPMHMAAAIGTPVLAVFGPTDSVRTSPYGTGHRVVNTNIKCRPCCSRICRTNDYSCLSMLTSESVGNTAMSMLKQYGAKV